MKKYLTLVMYPYFVSVIPVLFIASQNLAEVPASQIVFALLIAGLVVFTSQQLLNLVIKNKMKTSVSLSLTIGFFFIFGPLFDLLSPILGSTLSYWGSLVSISLLLLILLRLCYKKNPILCFFDQFISYFSTIMLVLIVFNILNQPILTQKISRIPAKIQMAFNKSVSNKTPVTAAKPESNLETQILAKSLKNNHHQQYPDIYYIIVDGYARKDILKNFYQFDNNSFEQQLANKSFYIIPKSLSNYPMTHLSLSSSLSMQYINEVIDENGNKNFQPYFNLIKAPKVVQLLKQQGYQYITLASGWGPTNNPSPLSDYHFRRVLNSINDYYQAILAMTPLKPFLGYNDAYLKLYTFKKLAEIPKINDNPKFVFSHIVMPHPPYLFNHKGDIYKFNEIPKDNSKEGYIEQLKFLNCKLLEVVDKIISRSKIEPIIIIQADHGSDSTLDNYYKGAPSQEQIQERFPIFHAIYAPDELKSLFYESITPINTFRNVLSYLNIAELETLRDENHFMWYYDDSNLYNVTQNSLAMNH